MSELKFEETVLNETADEAVSKEIAVLTRSDAAYEKADPGEEAELSEEILALEEDPADTLRGLDDDVAEESDSLVLEDETDAQQETPGETAGTPDAPPPADRKTVVGVRFRTAGKSYYFSVGELPVKRGSHVIVETARGQEYGTSVCDPFEIDRRQFKAPVKRIVRLATPADEKRLSENREREKEAWRICQEKIRRRGLDMKLIQAEYAFDRSKILFYFTSEGRVDFRDLVKDLAGVFHTRIELRQIGVRDETKILGGYGICGRPLCCHTYLSDFAPVSIRMAKEQNLSLNPTKISGSCGRLMCCLKNEAETYEELNRNLPGLGDEVEAADGLTGEVAGVDVLRQLVRILVEVDDEKELHEYRAEEITVLRRRKRGQAKPRINRNEVRDATGHGGAARSGGGANGRRGARPPETAGSGHPERADAGGISESVSARERTAPGTAADQEEPGAKDARGQMARGAEGTRDGRDGRSRRGGRPRGQRRGGRPDGAAAANAEGEGAVNTAEPSEAGQGAGTKDRDRDRRGRGPGGKPDADRSRRQGGRNARGQGQQSADGNAPDGAQAARPSGQNVNPDGNPDAGGQEQAAQGGRNRRRSRRRNSDTRREEKPSETE